MSFFYKKQTNKKTPSRLQVNGWNMEIFRQLNKTKKIENCCHFRSFKMYLYAKSTDLCYHFYSFIFLNCHT